VVDPQTGIDQGPNKEGEIYMRGPTITTGYLGDAGATAATIGQSIQSIGILNCITFSGFCWFHSVGLGFSL
jgi:acyl-CoA synthetase (AMP-forming)/AMP-acid ligase II